jgi:hypothetical protein
LSESYRSLREEGMTYRGQKVKIRFFFRQILPGAGVPQPETRQKLYSTTQETLFRLLAVQEMFFNLEQE